MAGDLRQAHQFAKAGACKGAGNAQARIDPSVRADRLGFLSHVKAEAIGIGTDDALRGEACERGIRGDGRSVIRPGRHDHVIDFHRKHRSGSIVTETEGRGDSAAFACQCLQ